MVDESPELSVMEEVDAAMQAWRQGDVAEADAFQHFADSRRPITPQAVAAAKQQSSRRTGLRIATKVDGLVVITQTCDIRRPCSTRPFVEACPLVEIDPERAAEAAAGERPQYAALPHLGPGAVADLDRVMTVEKGYLSLQQRKTGWSSDEEIRRFQTAVARRYKRFAFPDDFTKTLDRLRQKIISRHGKVTSPEGSLFAEVQEIRVTAEPNWNAPRIQATLTFILPPGTLSALPEELIETAAAAATRRWLSSKQRTSHEIAERLTSEADAAARDLLWTRLAEAWAANTQPTGAVTAVFGEVVDAYEYSIARYWESTKLDLDHLSDALSPE